MKAGKVAEGKRGRQVGRERAGERKRSIGLVVSHLAGMKLRHVSGLVMIE